jgi:hypothetical protein
MPTNFNEIAVPQFDVYLRNALQWGVRQIWAEGPDEALDEVRLLIEDDPACFEMFYDGEFCDTITHIRVCEPGGNDTLVLWRSADHRLRRLVPELLTAAEAVVGRWHEGNLAEAVRQLAAVIAKTKDLDD